ncbi:MAG: hypothetical protein MZU97_12635 [Bacillus subtilis]|nr:hypothetical protein [Bacillus subtilis]
MDRGAYGRGRAGSAGLQALEGLTDPAAAPVRPDTGAAVADRGAPEHREEETMKDVFIVEAVRTAIGSFEGAYAGVGAVDLGGGGGEGPAGADQGWARRRWTRSSSGCVLQAGLGSERSPPGPGQGGAARSSGPR